MFWSRAVKTITDLHGSNSNEALVFFIYFTLALLIMQRSFQDGFCWPWGIDVCSFRRGLISLVCLQVVLQGQVLLDFSDAILIVDLYLLGHRGPGSFGMYPLTENVSLFGYSL